MEVEGFQLGGTHLNKPVFISICKGLAYAGPFYIGENMIINPNLSDEKLLEAIYKAAAEYSKLINNSYLIIGKNRTSDYFWFQCYFEKKHFMHLLGINSKTLNASQFYDKCQAHNNGQNIHISVSDRQPSRNHNRTTINEKSSCCAEILQIQNAKYMKIGLKDKISQHVDFTYGYGNIATLGFKKFENTSFPITLIPRNLDEFTSQKYKILFFLQKTNNEKTYNNLLTEIKKELFLQMYPNFPPQLKELCEPIEKKLSTP